MRRWEAGQSNPSEHDLARFAEVCRLTPQQREFLGRLYARTAAGRPTAPELFKDEASRILSLNKPAYMVDDLFYVRAWNSYFTDYAGHLAPRLCEGMHALRLGSELGKREDPQVEAHRVRAVIRLLWMWTAHLASFTGYARMVEELVQDEFFAQAWQDIVNESGEQHHPPLVMPVLRKEYQGGTYTVYTGEVLFPPLYRAFIYEPADEIAWGAVSQHVASGPPVIHFANQLHWAE